MPHRRYSDCYTKCQSRWADVKCANNAPLFSRSGRIASGITWRRRGGAVLGRPHARTEGPAIAALRANRVVPHRRYSDCCAPRQSRQVSPEMVGSLSRGNDFGVPAESIFGGVNEGETRRKGVTTLPCQRTELYPEWGSPQNRRRQFCGVPGMRGNNTPMSGDVYSFQPPSPTKPAVRG